MNTKIKSGIALFLLASMLVAVGCGGTETPPAADDTTSGVSEDTTTAVQEYEYPYPDTGYGGEEYHILNMGDIYDMHSVMEREELNGETLNDAIYNRNRLIEQKFDIVLKETVYPVSDTESIRALCTTAQNSILAGEDEYDVMYLPMGESVSQITSGCFLDLTQIESLQLDENWWYTSFNEQLTINGALYSAVGSSNILVQDAIRLMAFNYDMMDNLKLELPYDLVRESKWTLDEFNKYITAAANLNGDDTAAWNKDGNCVYGYVHNRSSMHNFLIAADAAVVENENGTLVSNADSERFYNVVEKLSSILTEDDAKAYRGLVGTDMDAENGGYIYIFKNGRALFTQAEVNKAQVFRDLSFEYGVVPYPKYDEAQENYYSNAWYAATGAYIPATCKDPEKIGSILDAMSYEGERTVIPAFRSITVEQKGLRNDDSIEMLKIVTDSVVPVVYDIFNVGETLMSNIANEVWKKNGSTASLVAAQKSTIAEQIATVMENWNQ
ncbi:MAG: hypothetical protein IJ493_09880 [Clostridia bacterium]|nr:hypothetical protein [Clostridia bacterium]